jgi:outer membrane protein TolC
MKPKWMLLSIAVFASLSHPSAMAGIQNLSLRQALDLAGKQNLDLILASNSYESEAINFNNAWQQFWLPNVSLTAFSTKDLTLGSYPGTPASSLLPSGRNTGYPQYGIGVNLGSYTLFNFFRDRINYDNADLSFKRAAQVLEETRRSVSFRIISAYFLARLNQEKLDAAERSVDMARTLVRLVKSRVALGQATPTELSSVEVDANDAILQASSLRADYESSIFNLNALLNQNAENQIRVTTPLTYKPVTMTYQQALDWFKDRSPAVRSSRLSHQLAQGNLEIAEKNRMPLPTLSFSGISVNYGNRYAGGYTSYSNSNGSLQAGNIELEASLSLTLPILGPGGLFGENTVRSNRIQVNNAEVRLQQTMINGDLQIRSVLFQLEQLKDRIKTQELSFDSSSRLLGKVVEDMAGKKLGRLELRDAIDRARSTEIDLLQNKYSYITQKTAFYELIGKDWED